MDQRLKNITILLLTSCFFYSCSKSKNHRQQIFCLYEAGRFSEVCLITGQKNKTGTPPEVAQEWRSDRIIYYNQPYTAPINLFEYERKITQARFKTDV